MIKTCYTIEENKLNLLYFVVYNLGICTPYYTDMEKASILLRTSFVDNFYFHKCIFQNIHKQQELLWKSSFIGYNYAKYSIFKKKFSYFIWVYSTIRVNDLSKSGNFHNSQKFPQTMAAWLCLFPCLLLYLH